LIDIVTDGKLITKYQRQFIQQLKTTCREKIVCTLGHQGKSDELTVYYSEIFNFWFTSHENDNRYWNGFGFGRPQAGRNNSITVRNNSITVEINPPYEGINRNIGGVFGHDKNGEVLVLHRGKIGGGRVGVGKQLFFDNYREEPIIANDDGIENKFCLIGSLSSRHLPRQVGNFVSEVHRIKHLTTQEATDFSDLLNFKYTDEHSGTSKFKRKNNTTIERRKNNTTIERTHGIVVNSLASILENSGHKIGNDRNRDLFIHKRGQIKVLFEIKTSSSTQDLYSAVGQLLIYSIPIKGAVDLFLVLPDKLSKPVAKRLDELGLQIIDELGLQIIYYTWDNNEPTFLNLDKLL